MLRKLFYAVILVFFVMASLQLQAQYHYQSSFTRHTIVTASLTPASVSAYACSTQSMTVTGIKAGDHVINRDVAPSFTNNLMLNGIIVTGANTVSMFWCNDSGGAITPPSGTYTFDVEQ